MVACLVTHGGILFSQLCQPLAVNLNAAMGTGICFGKTAPRRSAGDWPLELLQGPVGVGDAYEHMAVGEVIDDRDTYAEAGSLLAEHGLEVI